MTCQRHDILKGIHPKALAVQATLLYVKPAVGEENFILEYLLNHDLTRIEVTWKHNGNVNLYIRQAKFDTQIPEFDTWIRQESKLAPLSNI